MSGKRDSWKDARLTSVRIGRRSNEVQVLLASFPQPRWLLPGFVAGRALHTQYLDDLIPDLGRSRRR